jgi:hypothetical protein
MWTISIEKPSPWSTLWVCYNILEASFSMLFGSVAGSIALVGFGLDSIVESLSGFILILRLRKHGAASEAEEETSEKKAIRFVVITFILLEPT